MKEKHLQSLPTKITAFILLLILSLFTLISAIGSIVMMESGYYTISKASVLTKIYEGLAHDDASLLLTRVLTGKEDEANFYCEGKNIRYQITDSQGTLLSSNAADSMNNRTFEFTISQSINFGDASYSSTEPLEEEVIPNYNVMIYLDETFPALDKFKGAHSLFSFLCDVRYGLIAIGITSALLALTCFIYLMNSAGHKKGKEGIATGSFSKFPLDLLSVAVALILFLFLSVTIENSYFPEFLFIAPLLFILGLTIFIGYCMNLAVQIKLGTWWKSSILCYLITFLLRTIKHAISGTGKLIQSLPLIWKSALFCLCLAFFTFLSAVLSAVTYDFVPSVLLWFLSMLFFIPAILYVSLMLRHLQKGTEKLAEGDLSYHVNTQTLVWDFKAAGESLNQISVGMSHAVDERLKSERFKTELITNVSHDIKTPLTSIINYADLIGKEPCENEKIHAYSTVLLRQSERLKKLIQDLVEASKASSGSVDVVLSPCELGVLLTQTVGEYQQKLSEHELLLIVKQPESPLHIMADGRLLWRVFDNLMNNIYQYAQSGTRVYLSVEIQGSSAVITFKNTSSAPLDLSPEDLMERFVRGDSSRNSEGSGLGLSIAQSLTELQSGTLALNVDGDLFKVILSFAILP